MIAITFYQEVTFLYNLRNIFNEKYLHRNSQTSSSGQLQTLKPIFSYTLPLKTFKTLKEMLVTHLPRKIARKLRKNCKKHELFEAMLLQ